MHAANQLCVYILEVYMYMYMHVLDKGSVATVTFAACGLFLATQREKTASIEIKNDREVNLSVVAT